MHLPVRGPSLLVEAHSTHSLGQSRFFLTHPPKAAHWGPKHMPHYSLLNTILHPFPSIPPHSICGWNSKMYFHHTPPPSPKIQGTPPHLKYEVPLAWVSKLFPGEVPRKWAATVTLRHQREQKKSSLEYKSNQKYPGTKAPLELEGVTPPAMRDSTFAPPIQIRTFMLANKPLIVRSQGLPKVGPQIIAVAAKPVQNRPKIIPSLTDGMEKYGSFQDKANT